jgi:hypothetical protein
VVGQREVGRPAEPRPAVLVRFLGGRVFGMRRHVGGRHGRRDRVRARGRAGHTAGGGVAVEGDGDAGLALLLFMLLVLLLLLLILLLLMLLLLLLLLLLFILLMLLLLLLPDVVRLASGNEGSQRPVSMSRSWVEFS